MRRCQFYFISFILSTSVFFGAATADTLKEAVEETVNTNPDVLIAAKKHSESHQRYQQAKAGYLPTVDVFGGYGRERSKNNTVRARRGYGTYDTLTRRESGVLLNQLLFDGFGTSSRMQSRHAEMRATAYAVQAVAQDLGLDAATAYINVLRAEELVNLAKANLSSHRRIFNMIKERGNAGVGREADVDQATGRLALAKANLKARESQYRDSKIEYLRVVGHAPTGLSLETISRMHIPDSKDQIVSMALTHHPLMTESELRIEQADADVHLAQSLFYPRFDAQVGGDWNHNIDGDKGTDNDYFAMLRMEYNVFNGGADLAKVREAKYRLQRFHEEHAHVKRQVEEASRVAWNEYYTAKIRKDDLYKHRESSRKTLNAYRKQFTLEKRTLLDLLDSENELFQASNAYADEQYNELVARYRVLHSMGLLLQTLDVPMPPEAYDDCMPQRHVYASEMMQPKYMIDEPMMQEPKFKGASAAVDRAPTLAQAEPIKTTRSSFYPVKRQAASTAQFAEQSPAAPAFTPEERQFVSAEAEVNPSFSKAPRFAPAATRKPVSIEEATPVKRSTTFNRPVNTAENASAEMRANTAPSQQVAQFESRPAISTSFAARPVASQPSQQFKAIPQVYAKPQQNSDSRWGVRLATFREKANADALVQRLASNGYEAFIQPKHSQGQTFNIVIVKPRAGDNKVAAQQTIAELDRQLQLRGFAVEANHSGTFG